MKHFFSQLTFLFLLSLSISAQTNGQVEISTTTIKFTGGYSAHCFVIWAQDANGKFVRTIKVRAQSYQGKLATWAANSLKNRVDAISGASLTSHGSHNVIWDLKDVNKQLVPDGNYVICIEGTQSNTLSDANLFKIPFTKGPVAQTKTIPDNANIKTTKVVYTPLAAVVVDPNKISAPAGWVSGLANPKAAGANRLLTVMVMGESAIDFSATGVTYGGQAMTKQSEQMYFVAGNRTYASIFTLKEAGIVAATSDAINVAWSTVPSVGSSVCSAFLINVDQNAPVGATYKNGLTGTTISSPSPLSTANGDLLVVCGSTADNNEVTFGNSIVEHFEANATWGDGVVGSKECSGTSETPIINQTLNGRLAMCALVIKKTGGSTINKVTLSTTAVNGKVFLNPAGGSYDVGSTVEVTADPIEGYVFDNWSGGITGTDNPYTITITSNMSITANFVQGTQAAGYNGVSWKQGGWNFGLDNNVNFAIENVVDGWQYDKGTYMPMPTDFTSAAATFKASNFAAGQVLAVAPVTLASCAAMQTRVVWDPIKKDTIPKAFRLAYLNKRKGDNTDRVAMTCPTIIPGTNVLDAADPALYANPAAFCMNDAYGRFGSAGAAVRYSVSFEPGDYKFLFKGNAAQLVDFRLLKRDANNVLSVIYAGPVSAAGGVRFNGAGATTEFYLTQPYLKLVDHMRLYATNSTYFSKQKDAVTGFELEWALSGDYVVELVSAGTSGAIGAFTFENVGIGTGKIAQKIATNNAVVYHSNNQLVVKLNNSAKTSVKIYDLAGSLIAQKANFELEANISTVGFAKGIYLVKIENGNNVELRKIQVLK